MAKSNVERKLAAILCADVVGYSRLMGENEEATLAALQQCRRVFSAHIDRHRGRVVNAPGDSILAEFASVVDAVNGAVEIQRELAERNQTAPGESQMQFRIGINLGDVMVDGDAIYGDGVNVAARLESLAEAGGICISGSAHQQVEGKLPLHYEHIGDQKVKNIAKPVSTYRVRSTPGAAAHRVVRAARGAMAGTRRNWAVVLTVVVMIAGVGGYFYWDASRPDADALVAPPNSVAVLAFDNLSGDPKQEYFSDAISENLLTALSRQKSLFVIARNSSFVYKGKAVDVKQVGRELGVRHVVEGSVQRAGDRVRIHVQVIDAATGKHLVAERYDRNFAEIFAVQDEIAGKVLNMVLRGVWQTIGEDAKEDTSRNTRDLKAIDLAWYATSLHIRGVNEERTELMRESIRLAEQALELEPDLPQALFIKGSASLGLGFRSEDRKLFKVAFQASRRLMEVAANDSRGHYLSGLLLPLVGKQKAGLAALERAIELNPNFSLPWIHAGFYYAITGELEKGLRYVKKGIRLDPLYDRGHSYQIGAVYYFSGQYQRALAEFQKNPQPRSLGWLRLMAATQVKVGDPAGAKKTVRDLVALFPKFTMSVWRKGTGGSIHPKLWGDYSATLRKAGIPE